MLARFACVHNTRYIVYIMEVGIRELRNNLASIMEAVDQGTVVTITHHGAPRATIRAVVESDAEVIERAVREGWLTRATGSTIPRRDRRPRSYRPRSDRPTALDALLEERADDR
jgi:prevent-host-death family protein